MGDDGPLTAGKRSTQNQLSQQPNKISCFYLRARFLPGAYLQFCCNKVARVGGEESRHSHSTMHVAAMEASERFLGHEWMVYNINAALKNQLIKFSSDGGETFSDITFPAGVWDYSSLNEAIQKATGKVGDKFPINLGFSLTTFRVTITLEENWQLDLTPSNFGNLIGFDKKILKDKLNIGPRVPNLSQDTDMLNVHCDLTNDSACGWGRKRYHLLLFHICSAGLL